VVWVRRREEGVGVESAVRVTVGVPVGQWRRQEPGQGRSPMPLLESRWRRRQQDRRDETLPWLPKTPGQ
jgi:hypothetical protein